MGTAHLESHKKDLVPAYMHPCEAEASKQIEGSLESRICTNYDLLWRILLDRIALYSLVEAVIVAGMREEGQWWRAESDIGGRERGEDAGWSRVEGRRGSGFQ